MSNPFFPVYGVGLLALTPSGSNPTPARLAILKDATVDQKIDTEDLYGEEMDPFDVANKSRKTTIKAKCAGFAADIYAALMGLTSSTGSKIAIPDEAATIPATPFQVTVAQGATFDHDLGVIDLTSGLAMVRVASAPSTGQYAVNTTTGAYTFAAADTGHSVLISYVYTAASAGKTVTVGAQLGGAGNVFSLDLHRTYKTNSVGLRFFAVASQGFSTSFGSQKHAEIDLEFTAYKDPTTNNLCTLCFAK